MDFTTLLLRLVIAIVCAGIANILIPRQIPGKGLGLVVVGLLGEFLGQAVAEFLQRQYGLPLGPFAYELQGVPILPAIVGSAVVLYLLTTILNWARYGNR